jgi:hypothetical protein
MSSSSSAANRRVSQKKSPKRAKGKSRKQTHVARPGWAGTTEGVVDVTMPLAATINNRSYSVIQTSATVNTLTSSSVSVTYGNFSYTLSLIDQVNSFTAVFDQYRIRMVELTFYPRVTVESLNTVNTGLLATVIDYDDASNLTSFAAALDYENCLVGRGLDPQKRTFIPHVAMAAYSGAFTSFANVGDQWIDCASTGVVHYGAKTAWTITDVAYTMDAVSRVWLEFRNVR